MSAEPLLCLVKKSCSAPTHFQQSGRGKFLGEGVVERLVIVLSENDCQMTRYCFNLSHILLCTPLYAIAGVLCGSVFLLHKDRKLAVRGSEPSLRWWICLWAKQRIVFCLHASLTRCGLHSPPLPPPKETRWPLSWVAWGALGTINTSIFYQLNDLKIMPRHSKLF